MNLDISPERWLEPHETYHLWLARRGVERQACNVTVLLLPGNENLDGMTNVVCVSYHRFVK